jgi:hypothetical protein
MHELLLLHNELPSAVELVNDRATLKNGMLLHSFVVEGRYFRLVCLFLECEGYSVSISEDYWMTRERTRMALKVYSVRRTKYSRKL